MNTIKCREKESFLLQKNMPSLTPTQNAALNIIDFLYIRDVESLSSFNDAKNNFYPDLLAIIDRINSVRNFFGIKAELYKHYLLCFLEIRINFLSKLERDLSEEKLDKAKFVLDELIYRFLNYGFSDIDLNNDLSSIINEYKSILLNEELFYKLVSQSLFFEYDNSSVFVYKKFLELNILKSSKYFPTEVKVNPEDIDKVFIRATLVVEFESIKNKFDLDFDLDSKVKNIKFNIHDSIEKMEDEFLKLKAIKIARMLPIEEHSEVILIDDINDKEKVEKYLENLSASLGRVPVFIKNIPDCNGYIGCWFSIFYKETNLKIPMYYPYFNNDSLEGRDNKVPADDIAREVMLTFGLKFKARTFHSYYINFYAYYKSIQESIKMLEIKYF